MALRVYPPTSRSPRLRVRPSTLARCPPPRLAAKLPSHCGVLDFLFSGVQISRTSRRQSHSGLLERLEDAKGCHPEREEEAGPPPPIDARIDESDGDPHGHGQRGPPHDKPLGLLSRSDIHRTPSRFNVSSRWLGEGKG